MIAKLAPAANSNPFSNNTYEYYKPPERSRAIRLSTRSLSHAPVALADGRKATGLTAAISDILKKDNPDLAYAGGHETHQALLIPLSALITRKAQNVTTATAGGHLVQDDIASQIEHSLRAASVCVRSGARVVANLRGDLTLGRGPAEVAVDWVAELDEVSPADPTYGAVKLTPSRLVATTSLSSQLHAQAPDVSAFIVESLSRGIGPV